MDINEASARILELFSQGMTSRQLLVLAAHHRRIELEKSLCASTNNKIIGGIFEGVTHTGEAHGSTLCPKILGTYEKEIAKDLQTLCEQKDCFVDIGCAEGYYTTGIAKTTDIKTVIGIDLSESALIQARESARLNKVASKCQFFSTIKMAASQINGKSLIMIDVEAAKYQSFRRHCPH